MLAIRSISAMRSGHIGDAVWLVGRSGSGAGSAGFSAAIAAADMQASVALIGHGIIGCTCVNVGCVPSTALIRAAAACPGEACARWEDGAAAPHLEMGAKAIAERMLPMLADVLGVAPDGALCRAAHRWRYAQVTRPLGHPFLRDADGTLHAGGDWCLGARVEDARASGDAITRDILAASGLKWRGVWARAPGRSAPSRDQRE